MELSFYSFRLNNESSEWMLDKYFTLEVVLVHLGGQEELGEWEGEVHR